MSNKDTVFYRRNQSVLVDFSGLEISSDGSVVLLEKIEKEHRLIKNFSKFLPDNRNQHLITYTREEQLKQRVFMLMLGYEDANDVNHLKNDPLFKDVLQGDLASQPTISRFENSLDKHTIFKLCNTWVDNYVSSLAGRKSIIIDVDATDDPTHGNQQMSLFNGYYGQFMLNELFFHDGETGQIILPVLRPGNSHSNKWYVGILKRIIIKIRKVYPDMKITIRTDSGFSCAPFYTLVDEFNLLFATGIGSNNVLKQKVAELKEQIKDTYLSKGEKYQEFTSFTYQANSWHKEQQCYAKVESTGKGMNVRFFVSNIEDKTAEQIYFDFYVKRGDASENRIKEIKNMCFSDRLSNHGFWANFFRLFISSLAYEMFLLIKEKIKKTSFEAAKKWQIDSIRVYLLKVGATIKVTKRRVYYQLSKAFVYKDLFREIITQ
ncbi:IS1380 family transposase [Lutibacter sp.]